MKKVLSLLLLCTMVAGCATFSMETKNSFSPQKLTQLSLGMNKEEVDNILGPPQSTTVTPRPRGDILEIWEYKARKLLPELSGDEYLVYFINDKVAKWGPRSTLDNL